MFTHHKVSVTQHQISNQMQFTKSLSYNVEKNVPYCNYNNVTHNLCKHYT